MGRKHHVFGIDGLTCCGENQLERYPQYILKHWYVPGISVVYAKTQKLVNWVKIPNVFNATVSTPSRTVSESDSLRGPLK